MARTRISTTVDSDLLSQARRSTPDTADAQLMTGPYRHCFNDIETQ